jgi:hypothetical protein
MRKLWKLENLVFSNKNLKGQTHMWNLHHVTLGSFCAQQMVAPSINTWHFRSRHLAVSDVDKWKGVIGPHGMVLVNHGLTHGKS